jgi:hypothetical protein
MAAPVFAWTDLGPGVRMDRAAGVVEFEGVVPTDPHDPRTPRVYLELIVTGPDSREHESLVMTRVKPSLIHAALLALGAEPGAPAVVRPGDDGTAERVEATGTPVRVELVVGAGAGEVVWDPAGWVVRAGDEGKAEDDDAVRTLADEAAWGGFVFAGSRVVTRDERVGPVYDADGTGVVIGLASFGSAVVDARWAVSPDSVVDAPAWVMWAARVPKAGTPVRVRVWPAVKGIGAEAGRASEPEPGQPQDDQ